MWSGLTSKDGLGREEEEAGVLLVVAEDRHPHQEALLVPVARGWGCERACRQACCVRGWAEARARLTSRLESG